MIIFNLFARPVYASCPVCIVTVGGGLILAKKLGVDDLLATIWLSGLNTALAFWIATKFKNRVFKSSFFWSILMYGATLAYLYFSKQFGHARNNYLGINKVIFGLTLGMLAFWLSYGIDKQLRKKNKAKVLFPYQKVIVPLAVLSVFHLIFTILLKN